MSMRPEPTTRTVDGLLKLVGDQSAALLEQAAALAGHDRKALLTRPEGLLNLHTCLGCLQDARYWLDRAEAFLDARTKDDES